MLEERVGTTLKGRYTIEALVGIGGMASVYRGRHRNGNKVAIKVLHPELCVIEDIKKRFLREGYVANKVEHRGAVTVLDDDTDEEDGSVFLVMELLEGETLEDLIVRRGGRLPADEILPIVKQILDVLEAAHAKGIVHRDLKPENVFLEKEGGGIKVLDFGIARLADGTGTVTSTGAVMGTPAYMAPEQARGETERIGPRTDLWAVGAIVFRALTGRVVFDAKAPAMSVVLAGTRPVPKILEVDPSVDPKVAAVVDKAIDGEVEARFENAAAMRDAIESLGGERPTARGLAATEAIAEAVREGKESEPALQHDTLVLAPTAVAAPSARADGPPIAPAAAKSSSTMILPIVAAALVALVIGGGIVIGAAYLQGTPSSTASSAPTASGVPSATANVSTSETPVDSASSPPGVSASAPAPPVSTPHVASASPPPPTKPKLPDGILHIVSFPTPAKVSENGEPLCTTPCKLSLSPGKHTFALRSAAGLTGSAVVQIKSGETTSHRVQLVQLR